MKKHLIYLSLLLLSIVSFSAVVSVDSLFLVNYSPSNLYKFRVIKEEKPLLLTILKDSMNARSIRNLPANLNKLTFDSSNLRKNIDSVCYYSFPYYLDKYSLDSLDTAKVIKCTKEALDTSPYFKDGLKRWEDKKIVQYIAFRTEYELLREFYSKFNLDKFKTTKVYEQLINRLQKEYVTADRVDSLLMKVAKFDYTPLHFYYKPNSIQEQISIDKVDIAAVDFRPIVSFYDSNKFWLDSAERKYGVNKEIIVGVLKKETNFGKAPMNYRLFEVLLGQVSRFINNQAALPEEIDFQEKRIEKLIRSAGNSLYHAVKYCLSNKLNPDSVRSNLVGAMGFPQFMPFNFGLAEDADSDGKADLSSMHDAIFSIANFFRNRGWKTLLNYSKEDRDEIIKFILSYNSNISYAEAVYEIGYELHKIKSGKSTLKKPKKKKHKRKIKSKRKKGKK